MAWTYVYGNYISYASGDHTVYIRNFLGYEVVTNNDTTYSVKFYSGFNWHTSTGTSKLYHISQNVTGTGQSAKSGSSSTTYTINTTSTAHAIIGAWTWSWNKSASASNKTITVTGSFTTSASTKSPPSITKTITVPALPKYTITYDGNGGTPTSTTQTKTYGVNINLLPGSSFTRNGYQPTMYTVPNWGTTYSLGQLYTSNANRTLKVLWQADYTITYNANNGIGAPAAQAKPYNIDTALSNTVPTRENYAFLGWATSASATTAVYQPGDTFSDNNNIILYAVWKLDKVQRNVFKLDASKNYIVTQEYIPTPPSREVRGNSIPGNFAFLGWVLERPSTIIYPVGTTTESIGALTEINADMSDTFYAVYVDDSPSELYKIYDGSVIPNVTNPSDIPAEFNDYIDAITNNKFYDNAAPYGADDVHTLFGYIQCNEDVHLSNVSGTCSNCAIPKTIEESVTDIYVGTTSKSETLNYTALEGTLIEVFFYKDTSSSTEPPDVLTFIGGQSEVKTYTNPATQITLTVTYNAGNNTITYVLNANPPGWWLLYLIKYTTEEVYDIGSSDLDSIQQVSNYIFYRITNNNITTSSKHTITITGIDSQNKAVSFTVENKIKIPLIDIQPNTSDSTDLTRTFFNQAHLYITNNNTIVTPNRGVQDNTYFTAKRISNPNADINFGIGSSGVNRGIWLDNKNGAVDAADDAGQWLIYGSDATDGRTNTYIPGNLYARIPWVRWIGSTEDNRRTDVYSQNDPALHGFNYWNGTNYTYSHSIGDNGCFEADPNGVKVVKSGTYLLLLSVHYNVANTTNQGVRCQFWNYTDEDQVGSLRYDKSASSAWGTLTNIATNWIDANKIIIPRFGHYTGSGWFRPSVVWFMMVRLS